MLHCWWRGGCESQESPCHLNETLGICFLGGVWARPIWRTSEAPVSSGGPWDSKKDQDKIEEASGGQQSTVEVLGSNLGAICCSVQVQNSPGLLLLWVIAPRDEA